MTILLGAQWDASAVDWQLPPDAGALPGESIAGPRDFARETAFYALFAGDDPVHIGRADHSLYADLRRHRDRGELAGRWDRFTWVILPDADAPDGGLLRYPITAICELLESGLELPPSPLGPRTDPTAELPVVRFHQVSPVGLSQREP